MNERSKVRSYRDLIVWQRAHRLAKDVLGLTPTFPVTDEATIIKRQLIRASTSVPANIAEGYGGNKGRVFQNSLTIACREATEAEYWILLGSEMGYMTDDEHARLASGYREVIAMLSSLIGKVGGAGTSDL